jgi:hypothetical protein
MHAIKTSEAQEKQKKIIAAILPFSGPAGRDGGPAIPLITSVH